MNVYEMELIRMIREHDDPGRALVIAVEVITSFLTQHGSSEAQEPACLQELSGTTQ